MFFGRTIGAATAATSGNSHIRYELHHIEVPHRALHALITDVFLSRHQLSSSGQKIRFGLLEASPNGLTGFMLLRLARAALRSQLRTRSR